MSFLHGQTTSSNIESNRNTDEKRGKFVLVVLFNTCAGVELYGEGACSALVVKSKIKKELDGVAHYDFAGSLQRPAIKCHKGNYLGKIGTP